MSEKLEAIETLRLIRAFSKIKDPQRRRLIIEFAEAAVPVVDADGAETPSDPNLRQK
jgi:hypothetical protein